MFHALTHMPCALNRLRRAHAALRSVALTFFKALLYDFGYSSAQNGRSEAGWRLEYQAASEKQPVYARVAELADALDLGSSGLTPLGVRVPPLAPPKNLQVTSQLQRLLLQPKSQEMFWFPR